LRKETLFWLTQSWKGERGEKEGSGVVAVNTTKELVTRDIGGELGGGMTPMLKFGRHAGEQEKGDKTPEFLKRNITKNQENGGWKRGCEPPGTEAVSGKGGKKTLL